MNHEEMISEMVRDEGLRLKLYLDSKGIPTIGVGRNLRDRGVTREEAYYLLGNDIEDAAGDLDHAVPWWRSMGEVRQRVLVNMCVNMGINRLLGFKKMLEHARVGEYALAAAEMLDSKWVVDVGPLRSNRLAGMMRAGDQYEEEKS